MICCPTWIHLILLLVLFLRFMLVAKLNFIYFCIGYIQYVSVVFGSSDFTTLKWCVCGSLHHYVVAFWHILLWIILMAFIWSTNDCWVPQCELEARTVNDYVPTNPPPSDAIPVVDGCRWEDASCGDTKPTWTTRSPLCPHVPNKSNCHPQEPSRNMHLNLSIHNSLSKENTQSTLWRIEGMLMLKAWKLNVNIEKTGEDNLHRSRPTNPTPLPHVPMMHMARWDVYTYLILGRFPHPHTPHLFPTQ